MSPFLQDLRNAIRSLVRDLSFTLPSLLTLSLGIGAVTVVFTVVQHVSLSSLGLEQPERLVTLRQNVPSISPIIPLSGQVLQELQKANQDRHPVSAVDLGYYAIPREGTVERWQVARVSENFFNVTGIAPILGRPLLPSDYLEDRRDVALVSHRLWQSLLGGRPDVVGEVIEVEAVGRPASPSFRPQLTIIGVLPPDLWLPWGEVDLIAPEFPETLSPTATAPNLFALARLSRGIPVETAVAELDQSYRQIEFADRLPLEGRSLATRVVAQLYGGQVFSELMLLWLASGALLLVVCANLANLVQARSTRRRGESALRYALGAGRFEAIRKPLVETGLLALLGGAAGMLLSYLSLDLLRSIPAVGLPRPQEIQLNSKVLAFSLLATLTSLFLFGVLPVLWEGRKPLANTLRYVSGRATDGRQMGLSRAGMIAGETAIAVALLVLATAALGSLSNLRSIDTGFQAEGSLIFQVDLPLSRVSEPADQQRVLRELLQSVRALPGVTSAAFANTLPLSFTNSIQRYLTEPGGTLHRANVRWITTEYFQSMGIPLLAGRDLEPSDLNPLRPVAVVNRKLAEQHWPGESPVGKQLYLGDNQSLEIVGLVGDVRQWQLTQPPEPAFYLPLSPRGNVSVVVRSSLDADPVIRSLRATSAEIDHSLILYDFTSLHERIDRNIGSDRLTAGLLNGFAVLCLILGGVGVYSVMSYSIAGRRREIGVRMALGAGQREIRRLLIREGILPALLGTASGLIGVLALSRLLESIFYEFTTLDSSLWIVGPLLLNLVAIVALWIPASSASRLDPQMALRT